MLVALYLRGGPVASVGAAVEAARAPWRASAAAARRRWPDVVRALRTADVSLGGAAEALYIAGLWQEANLLSMPGVLEWARRHAGEAVTPLLPSYPPRWIDRLGRSAPAAAWIRLGIGADRIRPLVGVVGSRLVDAEVGRFAQETGAMIVRLGFDLVSGGAEGCDRDALLGARSEGRAGLTLAPAALRFVSPTGGADISLSAPDEPFSVAAAMERNALIYAASQATVVVHARFRAGGGWHGATDAIRRRLCPVFVRDDPSSPAHRALIGLGARALREPRDLAAALADAASGASSWPQGDLFAYG